MKGKSSHNFWRAIAEVLIGSIALSLLTFVCFRLHANSTTVALLFLIVIVLVSLKSSLVPSAFVAIIAYVLLDAFFTEPLFTLGLNQPLDFVAPISYVTTAVVITRLMLNVRRSREDQRRAEETLRKAQADLAHVARVMTMGEFATSVAHEINQPLSAIVTNGSACLRWLAGDSPNLDEARDAARRIVRDGERAGDVLTRIRAFLKKSDTQKTRLNINHVIQEVVALTQDEATGRGVALRLELANGVPSVQGDRVQLQQVILNLVMNGIEAMTSVSDRPRVLFISSGVYESDKVLISVRDSGVGIDEQALEKIFDAFYTSKSSGMGMGLAISRSIVADHGGRLWATSNNGSGATFQFTLLQYR
jgi:C4-dicarboxylate-specific signal transduction histidine kinase